MQLATKPFGKVEVNPERFLTFQDGLYGFHDHTEFILLDDRDDSPFLWLQSIKDSSLAFVLIHPQLFLKEPYDPGLSQSELEALGINSIEECLIYLIVTIPENQPEKMTANLQGPVLINEEKRIGRQVISNNDKHSVRVSILEQVEE